MRFMFIVKSDHNEPPPPALYEAMQKLTDRETKAGRLLDTGGQLARFNKRFQGFGIKR